MLLNCLSQCPFPGGALFPLLLRAANGIFMITTVSSTHLSHPGCTFSTSVTRATIRHLTSWCPVWLLSLINCWFNHTLQSCYIQIHNGNFCAYIWPSPVSWPPKRLFISSDPPVVVFVSVYHAHSEVCRPPPFCWASFLAVVLQLWSAAYNLYCYADGFFRNDFYIYLKILNYGIFVFVFVVSHLSIISYQFCSLLAMDKIGSFRPLKKINL